MFCTALVVRRRLFRDINKAFVFIFRVFLTCNHLLIDFFAAGVRKILRSLFPLPIIVRMSLLIWSVLRLANSDSLNAQLRKIVIIQWSLDDFLHSINKRTDSSRLRYFGTRFGNLGVSSSSAILLSIRWAYVLRYFQNWRIDTIFLALVPAEAFRIVWQCAIKAYISLSDIDLINSKSTTAKLLSIMREYYEKKERT